MMIVFLRLTQISLSLVTLYTMDNQDCINNVTDVSGVKMFVSYLGDRGVLCVENG